MRKMLVPMPWQGISKEVIDQEMCWIKQLPATTYCALWQRWPENDLPPGHDCYVVSFHLEAVDIDWIKRQCEKISAPIILLSDSNYYDWKMPKNLKCYTWYYWHFQLDKILEWYPDLPKKNIQYKSSAICNRLTQSKILVITKLLENPNSQSLTRLSTWLENKNLHFNTKIGRPNIDGLTEIFWKKYFGKEIKIDNFDNNIDNHQKYTANPLVSYLQEAAIHFTNESFHYSYHQDQDQHYIYPGPFLTEKTLKCLIAETGFISVGQFDTYNTLSKLGLKFNYNNINTSWDQIPGDLDRLEKILELVDSISSMESQEIFDNTVDSSRHNREYIVSGQFAKNCDMVNQTTEKTILDEFAC